MHIWKKYLVIVFCPLFNFSSSAEDLGVGWSYRAKLAKGCFDIMVLFMSVLCFLFHFPEPVFPTFSFVIDQLSMSGFLVYLRSYKPKMSLKNTIVTCSLSVATVSTYTSFLSIYTEPWQFLKSFLPGSQTIWWYIAYQRKEKENLKELYLCICVSGSCQGECPANDLWNLRQKWKSTEQSYLSPSEWILDLEFP